MPPTPDDVLAALDPEQREVALAQDGPVCVLAGAGTGKTRALTHRLAYGVLAGILEPQRVLAVTFTARAAGELRTRLRLLGVEGVQARTFHAAALRQLQFFWPRAVGGPVPRLVDSKIALVAEAASRLRLATDRTTVRDLAAEVEWAKATMTSVESYPAAAGAAGRMPPGQLDLAAVGRVLAAYEERKRARGLMDFEDVLLFSVALLADHRDVVERVREQYTAFVVDEYQDVNPAQQALLDLWLGDRDQVCVVGDAAQTIYSFTGASPRYLTDFRARFPSATQIRLVRDYRSTPQVVALANRVLAQAGSAGQPLLHLVAQRPDGPTPGLREYADDPAEAAGVAAAIGRLMAEGTRPSEIAVLYRTNGQSEALEAALADAGIPYLVRGGERFFARPEVRQALLLLRGQARAGAATGDGLAAEVRGVLSATGWSEVAPPGAGAARERWESLQALVALALELAAARPEATLADLVADLEERADAQHPPTAEGVTLSSLHAAKGLEWDAVFLVGICEGLLPISFADTAEAVAEERRLLYVGVTRAREHLEVSWSRARTPGSRGSRSPSRFLDGLQAAGVGGRFASGTGRPRSTTRRGSARRSVCRSCQRPLSTAPERKLGRCVGCPANVDEQLFERLRAWRLETSRSQSVPAFVVFTDATLTAIAESRPQDAQALAGISGVGQTKLDKYGAEVLEICAGAAPSP